MPPTDESAATTMDDPTPGGPGSVVSTARWFADAARELREANDWHDTAQRIADLAAEIADADLAALIGVDRPNGMPDLLAATDVAAGQELVAAQRTAGSAPAWQVILDRGAVRVDDLAADTRWAAYSELVTSRLGFRTVLAFCLPIGDRPVIALAVYSRRPRAFTAEQVELTAALAELATVALNEATQTGRIGNLQIALDHARDIGAAIGILMDRQRITQPAAYRQLRDASQNQNRKLYDIAVALVETSHIPTTDNHPANPG